MINKTNQILDKLDKNILNQDMLGIILSFLFPKTNFPSPEKILKFLLVKREFTNTALTNSLTKPYDIIQQPYGSNEYNRNVTNIFAKKISKGSIWKFGNSGDLAGVMFIADILEHLNNANTASKEDVLKYVFSLINENLLKDQKKWFNDTILTPHKSGELNLTLATKSLHNALTLFKDETNIINIASNIFTYTIINSNDHSEKTKAIKQGNLLRNLNKHSQQMVEAILDSCRGQMNYRDLEGLLCYTIHDSKEIISLELNQRIRAFDTLIVGGNDLDKLKNLINNEEPEVRTRILLGKQGTFLVRCHEEIFEEILGGLEGDNWHKVYNEHEEMINYKEEDSENQLELFGDKTYTPKTIFETQQLTNLKTKHTNDIIADNNSGDKGRG
jgi:hypothetical protein